MTAEERPETLRDLELAIHTAASLQETIRHADTKAQALLGLQGGMAVIVLQQAPILAAATPTPILAAVALAALGWLGGLTFSAWHLLVTMLPRLAGAPSDNRFTFPATRPRSQDIQAQRDEAWDAASSLARIAVVKLSRIRRSWPGLITGSVSAAALLALAVVVGVTT